MAGSGLLVAILAQTPVYLVLLVGVILAFVGWKNHPSVSLVALIAFVVLFHIIAGGPTHNGTTRRELSQTGITFFKY